MRWREAPITFGLQAVGKSATLRPSQNDLAMLIQRLLTALILIPLVLGSVYWLPTPLYAVAVAVFILLGAWEWAQLGGLRTPVGYLLYALGIGGLLLGAAWLLHQPSGSGFLLGLAGIWWLIALGRLCHWPAPKRAALNRPKKLLLAAGIPMLVPAWAALVWLHLPPYGVAYVLNLLVIVWLADTVAFFAGRRWGKQRLAPTISPGKTREGFYAALLATLLFAGGVALVQIQWQGWSWQQGLFWVGLNGVTMIFSVVGDLTESLFKRQGGVKDSGALLPGHGGILDRIDSLLAAAPVFALGLWLGAV